MSRAGLSHARSPGIAAGLLVPVVAFVVFLETFGDATEALAVAEALPLLWVLVYAVWRRRIEPVGALAVAGFAVALLLTIVLGGSSRPLELHRALFPGMVGLACLVSLGLGRPLLWSVAVKRGRADPETATRSELDAPGARHVLVVVTAIVGVFLTADAATQVTLAFTVSTSTFGVVSHVASWAIIGKGIAAGALYLHRVRSRKHDLGLAQSPRKPTATTDPATLSKRDMPS